MAAILSCGEQYVSFLSVIQPANYEDSSLAVARYPDDPVAWFCLGETAQAIDPQTALAAYSRVVQLEPSKGLAWCRLGCCRNGDPGYNGCNGAGERGELAIWSMKKSRYANAFSMVGFADDDFHKQNNKMNDYPVLGTTRDIPELVRQRDIGLILFAITRCTRKERERILATCKSTPARVVIIPDFIGLFKRSLQKQTDEDLRS